MSQASATSVTDASAAAPAERTLFDHPRGLTFLVLTGIWENCALFGMRTVLIYYLVNQLKLPTREAVDLYALFSASALLGIVGGFAADRYLGLRRAIIGGILLMAVGLFMLAAAELLIPALVLIAVGNGLTRPTLVAQVGLLYALDDPRRDRAFNIYYVGCNVGAVLAPLIAGTIGEFYGWHWAFVVSGAGMLLSIAIYLAGAQWLPDGQRQSQQQMSGGAGNAPTARNVLLLLGFTWISGLVFWSAYGQVGSTVALWAEQSVDRGVDVGQWDFTIPATWFQGFNPLFIFAFAPLVNWLWSRERAADGTARELRRLSLGGVLMAISFATLAVASTVAGDKPNWLWLCGGLALFTLAELYFTPVGLSLFSRLALKGLVAAFVSAWSLAMMVGYAASGWLAHLWGEVSTAAFFGIVAGVALSVVLIIPLAARFNR